MIRFFFPLLLLITIFTSPGCGNKSEKSTDFDAASLPKLAAPVDFNSYWGQGKAELSTYEVTHEGSKTYTTEQQNTFVIENFSRDKQIKTDTSGQAASDRFPVLQFNSVRQFRGADHDSPAELSIFTPVDGTPTLQLTDNLQDPAGQATIMINLDSMKYHIRQGDQDTILPLVVLEDDLWSHIRLHPDLIRLNRVNMIPAALYLRFRQEPVVLRTAMLKMDKGEKENVLHVDYDDIKRSLNIRFESVYPYRILGWEEKENGRLTSKGNLKSIRM